jgi:hypothetical protein
VCRVGSVRCRQRGRKSSVAITSAALAPYRDELLRDAPALCSDLTRPPTIVPSVSQGAVWEQAVQSVFAAASPSLPNDMALSLRAAASHLTVDGHDATGIFSLIASEPTTEHGAPDAKIVSLGRYQLSLEEVAGRWLVSSPMRLVAVSDCQLKPHGQHPRRQGPAVHARNSARPDTRRSDPHPDPGAEGQRSRATRIQGGPHRPRPVCLPGLPQDRRHGQPRSRSEPHAHRRTTFVPPDRTCAAVAPSTDALIQEPPGQEAARPHTLPVPDAIAAEANRRSPSTNWTAARHSCRAVITVCLKKLFRVAESDETSSVIRSASRSSVTSRYLWMSPNRVADLCGLARPPETHSKPESEAADRVEDGDGDEGELDRRADSRERRSEAACPSRYRQCPNGASRDRTGDLLLANLAGTVVVGVGWASLAS